MNETCAPNRNKPFNLQENNVFFGVFVCIFTGQRSLVLRVPLNAHYKVGKLRFSQTICFESQLLHFYRSEQRSS